MSAIQDLLERLSVLENRFTSLEFNSKEIREIPEILTVGYYDKIAIQQGSLTKSVTKGNLLKGIDISSAQIESNTIINQLQQIQIDALSSITDSNTKYYSANEYFNEDTQELPTSITLSSGDDNLDYSRVNFLNGMAVYLWTTFLSEWHFISFVKNKRVEYVEEFGKIEQGSYGFYYLKDTTLLTINNSVYYKTKDGLIINLVKTLNEISNFSDIDKEGIFYLNVDDGTNKKGIYYRLENGSVIHPETVVLGTNEFTSVEELKTFAGVIGDNAITKSYYENINGGGNQFKIVDDNTLVDDGGNIIELDNGLFAVSILSDDFISFETYGARGDGTDDSIFFQKLVDNNDRSIKLKDNKTYRVSNIVTNKNIQIQADKNVRIELSTDGTETIFECEKLSIIGDIVITDRGRSGMDKTGGAATYLFETKYGFKAKDCTFLTDRSVVFQTGSPFAYSDISNTHMERVTDPISGEATSMNIFVIRETPFTRFERNTTNNTIGRNIYSSSYNQGKGIFGNSFCIVRDNTFNLHRTLDITTENSLVKLVGPSMTCTGNTFVDCFGRHIDMLGDYSNTPPPAHIRNTYKSIISDNNVNYTVANQNEPYTFNHEAGSIYVRYKEVNISDNHLDYTNLLNEVNGYHAISVRHGVIHSSITDNIIIKPFGSGIYVDISDSISTDSKSINIDGNTIIDGRFNTSKPIQVTNISSTKILESLNITNNTASFSSNEVIEIKSALHFDRPFLYGSIRIFNNVNTRFNVMDRVEFDALPVHLDAPNLTLNLTINETEVYNFGNIKTKDEIISVINNYKVKELNITYTSPNDTVLDGLIVRPKSKVTTLKCNNKLKIITPATQTISFQTIFTENNIFIAEDVFVSTTTDSLTAVTNQVYANGGGGKLILRRGLIENGKFALTSLNAEIDVIGTEINGIKSDIVRTHVAGNLFKQIVYLAKTTGSGNNNLYDLSGNSILYFSNSNSLGTISGSGDGLFISSSNITTPPVLDTIPPSTPILDLVDTNTFTININGGDDITTNNDLKVRVYDTTGATDISIYTSGTIALDADLTILGQIITLVNVPISSATKFKVSLIDEANNESSLSNEFSSNSFKVVLNPNATENSSVGLSGFSLASTKFVIETKLPELTGTWSFSWGTFRYGVSGGNFVVGTTSGFDRYDLTNIVGSDLIITYDVATFDTSVSVNGTPLALISTAGTKIAITSNGIDFPVTGSLNSMEYLRLLDDTTILADYKMNDGSGLVIEDSIGSNDMNITVGTGDINVIWEQI